MVLSKYILVLDLAADTVCTAEHKPIMVHTAWVHTRTIAIAACSLTKADAKACIELYPSQKLDDIQEDSHLAVDPGKIDEELAQVHNVSTVHPSPLLNQPGTQLVRHNCDCTTQSTCQHKSIIGALVT